MWRVGLVKLVYQVCSRGLSHMQMSNATIGYRRKDFLLRYFILDLYCTSLGLRNAAGSNRLCGLMETRTRRYSTYSLWYILDEACLQFFKHIISDLMLIIYITCKHCACVNYCTRAFRLRKIVLISRPYRCLNSSILIFSTIYPAIVCIYREARQ